MLAPESTDKRLSKVTGHGWLVDASEENNSRLV